MKYAWIDGHRDDFSVARMCRQLGVSRTGYCQWRTRPPSPRAQATAALDVPVLRRFTAGGAVYHDEGNLNVTIVLGRADLRLAARPELGRVPGLYRLVLDPLAAAVGSLGAPAVATERDLLVAGAKISGVAAWLGSRALLVHGTLLIDADLGALGKVLDGPGAPGDPRWERTRSRRSAVPSLAREIRGSDPTTLDAAVETAVVACITGGDGRRGRPTDEEVALANELIRSRYGRPTWHRAGT